MMKNSTTDKVAAKAAVASRGKPGGENFGQRGSGVPGIERRTQEGSLRATPDHRVMMNVPPVKGPSQESSPV